jgi:magnesium-dependent phosphatase 1
MTSTAVLIAPIFAVWTLIAPTTEGFIIRHANFVSAGSSIMDATKDSSTCAIVPTGTLETPAPKLIVFDLDNTLWTPELYTLRNIERDGTIPVARKDVNLFPGAQEILQMIHDGKFNATQFAVASRTKSVDWAHDLLHQFNIRNLFQYIEIFPGDKTVHFSNIRAASGISYREMMFFDDARHGKYGNCIPVSEMGVLAVHCPNGLQTIDLFHTALRRYQEWNGSKGTIVEWDGTVSYLQNTNTPTDNIERQQGQVRFVNYEKKFGFIRYKEGRAKDVTSGV